MDSKEAKGFLTMEGAASDLIGSEPVISIPPYYVTQTLNTWTARRVLDFWVNLPGFVHSNAFIRYSGYVTKQLLDYIVCQAFLQVPVV